jgi:hypothetical protein
LAEKELIRNSAMDALISIGSANDVPVFVAMLYDPDPYGSVRLGAVKALGKYGDEPALLALEIWQKQAVEADKNRTPQEKWFIGSTIQAVDESKAAIKRRVESRTIKATP